MTSISFLCSMISGVDPCTTSGHDPNGEENVPFLPKRKQRPGAVSDGVFGQRGRMFTEIRGARKQE